MKIESAALQFSTRPTVSRPGDSAISVLKAQRDEISSRVELVKKSNLSFEAKQEKIRLLQDQIGNLNGQIDNLQLKEMTESVRETAQSKAGSSAADVPQTTHKPISYA